MMNQADLMRLILGKEQESIIRTLAMMAYVLAIGRVLEKNGVNKFSDLMVATIPKFYGYVTREHFEKIHSDTCEEILTRFKTAKGGQLTYGQAQKPLNVFFKVYIDFARKPDSELAGKLAPFLHVPLDSLLMGFFAQEFPKEYKARISRLQNRYVEVIAERLHLKPQTIPRALFGKEFALLSINKEIYLAWQEFLRQLYPAKPVELDSIWMLERSRLRRVAGHT